MTPDFTETGYECADWISSAQEWACKWTLLDTAINRLYRRRLTSWPVARHLASYTLDPFVLYAYCARLHLSFQDLRLCSTVWTAKGFRRTLCLKSLHLSKYVNLAADKHLASGVVQDSAQKRVFTTDRRRARNRHLYIRHSPLYPKTYKWKQAAAETLSLFIRITALFLHMAWLKVRWFTERTSGTGSWSSKGKVVPLRAWTGLEGG
jgi:hypothetical protein